MTSVDGWTADSDTLYQGPVINDVGRGNKRSGDTRRPRRSCLAGRLAKADADPQISRHGRQHNHYLASQLMLALGEPTLENLL